MCSGQRRMGIYVGLLPIDLYKGRKGKKGIQERKKKEWIGY